MAIFRGTGGSGDAAGGVTLNTITQLSLQVEEDAAEAAASEAAAAASASAASSSQTAAASSATSASTSATNAATSASNAASSASSASTSASNAATSASAASTSASNAATSATNAATSETNAANSASAASTSATNAANSASAAATSATNAANSATTATTQATNAATSASNAATSASNAATSETNAANSATTATTQAGIATTQATNASNSASAAATSASNAATSETNAASSASAAATSASNAATSETNAANSASAASTSASNAATSASNAATSETNAASSASAASSSATASAASAASSASSAAAAAASLDSFDDRYLGAKASAPTLDNDGNALITGALYYDTTEGTMYVYDGAQWIAASAASQAILTVYNFTATNGQTTFTGVDDNAATLSYVAGSIIVTLNGIFLENGTDYTATDGVNVVLAAGAVTSDEVNVYSFNTFDVANVQAIGDDRYVRLTTDQTVAGAKTFSSNPVLSAGTVNGVLYLNGSKAATSGSALVFDGANVGIGTSSPGYKLDISGVVSWLPGVTGAPRGFLSGASGDQSIEIGTLTNSPLGFATNSARKMTLDSSGNLGLGVTPSAWSGSYKAFEGTYGGALFFYASGNFPSTWLSSNAYYNGTNWIAKVTDQSCLYQQEGTTGKHIWSVVGSDTTAGAAITFTQAMTLDASGNLGIGTTSPSQKLHVYGSQILAVPGVSVYTYYDSTGTYIGRNSANGALQFGVAASERMRIDSSGNLIVGGTSAVFGQAGRGLITVNGPSQAAYGFTVAAANHGIIAHTGTDLIVSNYVAGALTFQTSDTERLRIDSSGNVGIGTSSPASSLDVNGSVRATRYSVDSSFNAAAPDYTFNADGGLGMFRLPGVLGFSTAGTERMRIDSSGNLLVGTTSNTEGARIFVSYPTSASGGAAAIGTEVNGTQTLRAIAFRNPNGLVGTITTSGSATAYNTSSDYRLKEDWQPMTGASERVKALKPVNFAWKVDGSRVDGFLAHEAQAVVPEAVTGEKDAVDAEGKPVYQGIDQSKLVPLLTAALQEALAEIESLTARIETLENK